MIAITTFSWLQKQEMIEAQQKGLSQCWCGETPGSCVDCQDCDVSLKMTKVNVSSGEDSDCFR